MNWSADNIIAIVSNIDSQSFWCLSDIWISFSRIPVNIFYVIVHNSFHHFKIEHVSWKGYNDNNDSLITSQYFWSEILRGSWKSQVIHIFNCGMRWVKYYLWQATRSNFISFWRSCISDRWSKHALILGSSMQLKNFSSEKREILCCWMLFHIQMA